MENNKQNRPHFDESKNYLDDDKKPLFNRQKVIQEKVVIRRIRKQFLSYKEAEIILALLSYVAETEYRTIHQRQAEGIAAAKARGVKLGRPPKPLPDNFHEVYQKWKAGKISTEEAARQVNMPPSTYRYRASVYKNATLS